ncbi:YciI family protein [Aliihoeflea sp. 40Bstr573]|uniref:YciI family protein n=1 Tax=Aliihoeflea sp. 40Bstr573 TaxID=2696467 RepID=UPI002094D19E|nr:YciI family protein [Aliihoeflea sp. 40Bstr573]MCO6386777.1 YciI family protein [Aliihoeflea sp. 40Bstr573]
MLYAILCYNNEDTVGQWTKEEDDAVMARLDAVLQPVERAGQLGPVARLLPTSAATTLRKASGEPLVIDGPFAETKEQFLGFYLVDFDSLDQALAFSKDLAEANPGGGSYEIRPVGYVRDRDREKHAS